MTKRIAQKNQLEVELWRWPSVLPADTNSPLVGRKGTFDGHVKGRESIVLRVRRIRIAGLGN